MSEKIGSLWADSPKCRTAKTVVQNGFWAGNGLMAEVIAALEEFETATINYGWLDSEQNYRLVKKARLRLFNALKQIEIVAGETATISDK